MKTGELATRFQLDPKTVKAWTDEFEEFFSKDAKGIGRTQRFYHPEDQIVLNTILSARAERRKAEEIRAMLAGGERNHNLPAEFAIMKREDTVTVLMEVRILQLQIENLSLEITRLQAEKDEISRINQEREAQLLQKAKEKEEELNNDIKELNKEIRELYGEVGKWRALYGDLKERMEEDDK